MNCRIYLNGSTEKFNGSYCQDMNWQAWHHYHYCAIANDMFGYYYAKLREWVPWIVFCVILHRGFNVKIKWESNSLKIQYFFVFWD